MRRANGIVIVSRSKQSPGDYPGRLLRSQTHADPWLSMCSPRGLPVFVMTVMVFFLFIFLPGSINAEKNIIGLCAECHPEASDYLKKTNIHKPVRLGLCTSCHNPHASKHTGLLLYELAELCYKCHDQKRGFTGDVVHKPVEDGACGVCHEPHSSNNQALAKKTGGEGCYSCHPKEKIAEKKNIHPEVKKGNCSTCHTPHASNVLGLLKKSRVKTCASCHENSARLEIAHKGFNVSNTDCVGCHSPHSSDNKAILKIKLHKPFKEGNCNVCHIKGAREVANEGKLCNTCHPIEMLGFNKIYTHLFVSGEEKGFCSRCHSPHASDEPGFLKERTDRVCYACHGDTKKFVAASKEKHPKIGECSSCHISHGSNSRFLLTKGAGTCSTEDCHVTQGTFTHPVGERAIDPRSKEPMTCSTCHNPMGSPEDFILRASGERDLCVQCHQM